MEEGYSSDIKIVVIGDAFTGKTSFVQRWVGNKFISTYKATISSEFGYRIVKKNGHLFRVQLWDLAGQDRNITLSKVLSKNAQGAIVLCSADVPESLENCVKWKNTIFEQDNVPKELMSIILIQNKSDLIQVNEIDTINNLNKIKDQENFIEFFRVSAKTGENIQEAMDCLLDNIISKFDMSSSFIEKNKEGSYLLEGRRRGMNNNSFGSESEEQEQKNCCI